MLYWDNFHTLFSILKAYPSQTYPDIAYCCKEWLRTCSANSGSALKRSALRLSCAGPFPLSRVLMAVMISSFSGSAMLTSRSVSGSCTSTSIVGGVLFRTSLKCSAHLASCSASVVSSLSCLSTIGVSVAPRYFPLTSLVILYTCPCSPLLATYLVCRSIYPVEFLNNSTLFFESYSLFPEKSVSTFGSLPRKLVTLLIISYRPDNLSC